jgi:hypothetical protein
VLAIGVVYLALPHRTHVTKKETAAQDAIVRLASRWDPAALKPERAPFGLEPLEPAVKRVDTIANAMGSLVKVDDIRVIDGGDREPFDPKAPAALGRKVDGLITASFTGEFMKGRGEFMLCMRPTRWGLEVVSVSRNLVRTHWVDGFGGKIING